MVHSAFTVRNATAAFIVNLSLADLLLGCVNLPLAAHTFAARRWPHGRLLCHVFSLLRYALVAVSLLSVSPSASTATCSSPTRAPTAGRSPAPAPT
ncbi:G-protein coupled receptor moody [Gryllus bimaculatus]|nr:G-protein coupled receptor moody [Gryllus bimaculatus]